MTVVIAGVDAEICTVGAEYAKRDLERFGYTVQLDPAEIPECHGEKTLVILTATDAGSCDHAEAVFFIGDDDGEDERRLIDGLTGHAHLRIIGNRYPGERGLCRLCEEIRSFVGVPEPLEIERKFLIERPGEELLGGLRFVCPTEISQTYLIYENGERARVRRRSVRGRVSYYHTVKKKISDAKRIEIERLLTEEEYLELLSAPAAEKYTIAKRRYCVSYNSQYFELDLYPFMKNEALLEIELCHEDEEILFPEWVKLIREVTSDKSYTNYSMAKKVTEGKQNEAY